MSGVPGRKMIDLGWCMGRLEIGRSGEPSLRIVSPCDLDENSTCPAQSVLIFGGVNVIALRDALNEALPADGLKPCVDDVLVKALKEICLCSVNSASNSREMGDIARRALAALEERQW